LKRLPYKEAEKRAKEVKAMLNSGADWDKVSKEYSQDQSGKPGRITKGQIEKSIEGALFSMKVGEISDVVGSVYGFHILRLDEKEVKPFEDFREPIRQKLVADEVDRQLDAKVKEAGVKIDESFFK
jgi:foldase protein PrsA